MQQPNMHTAQTSIDNAVILDEGKNGTACRCDRPLGEVSEQKSFPLQIKSDPHLGEENNFVGTYVEGYAQGTYVEGYVQIRMQRGNKDLPALDASSSPLASHHAYLSEPGVGEETPIVAP